MVKNYNLKTVKFLALSIFTAAVMWISSAYCQTTHFSTTFSRTQTISNGYTNEFRDIKTDANGNTYILCNLTSTQTFNSVSYNAGRLIIKYDASGQIVWVVGTSGKDGTKLLLDTDENIIVVGNQTTVLSNSGGAFSITKLAAADGALVWENASTKGSGLVQGATLSPDGGIYIAFSLESTSDGINWGAVADFGFSSGSARNVVIKADKNGNPQWAKYVTSDATTVIQGEVYGMCAGENNEIYLVGKGDGLFADAGTKGTFISRINSDGSLSWFKRMSTSTDHSATDVIFNDGSVYACGDVANQAYTSLDLGNGVNTTTLDFQKGYIAKLKPDGTAQ